VIPPAFGRGLELGIEVARDGFDSEVQNQPAVDAAVF
jgi:hypothetical protein